MLRCLAVGSIFNANSCVAAVAKANKESAAMLATL